MITESLKTMGVELHEHACLHFFVHVHVYPNSKVKKFHIGIQ